MKLMKSVKKGELITITVRDCYDNVIFKCKADINNQRQVEDALISLSHAMNFDLRRIIRRARQKELDLFGIKWEAK